MEDQAKRHCHADISTGMSTSFSSVVRDCIQQYCLGGKEMGYSIDDKRPVNGYEDDLRFF